MNIQHEKYIVTVYNGSEGTKKFRNIAKMHKEIIDTGFLSSFSAFILSQLYLSIAKSRFSSLCVCTDTTGQIIGFIAISFSTSSFYKSFILRKGVLLSPFLIGRIFSIEFLKKLSETLLYPFKSSSVESNYEKIDSEILNFCVTKNIQRMGIGQSLFNKGEEEFRNNSIKKIQIVTGGQQKSAHRFYEKCGAKLIASSEIHKNTESLIYNYEIF